MASQTTMFATLFCALGVGPSSLTVLPLNRVPAQGQLAADIGDDVSVVNITSSPCVTPLRTRSWLRPPRQSSASSHWPPACR